MPRIPKVRAWSNTVRRDQLRVSDVDLYVLRDQPEVLRALGRESVGAESPGSAAAAAAVRVVALAAPLAALLVFGGEVPGRSQIEVEAMEGDLAVGFTAACFALALPGPVLLTRRWWRSGRRRDVVETVAAAVAAVVGVLVLRAMTSRWEVEPLAPAAAPVWVTTVLSSLVLVTILVASRGRRTPADLLFRVVGPADPTQVTATVESLPPKVRAQLVDMRTRALERLHERELIDREQVAALVEVPLGHAPISPSR